MLGNKLFINRVSTFFFENFEFFFLTFGLLSVILFSVYFRYKEEEIEGVSD